MQLSGSSESAKVGNITSNEGVAFTAHYLLDPTEAFCFLGYPW